MDERLAARLREVGVDPRSFGEPSEAFRRLHARFGRRATLDRKRVEEIAHSMLADGQKTPILVRPDGARFVLIEGLHRLEAAKALGERTIVGFRVNARKH